MISTSRVPLTGAISRPERKAPIAALSAAVSSCAGASPSLRAGSARQRLISCRGSETARANAVGWVAGGFVVGAFVGALLVPYVPQAALRTVFGVLLVYVGFTFLVTPPESRSAALLPAGLATFWTWVVGRWLRRWTSPAEPLPPGEDVEYHI